MLDDVIAKYQQAAAGRQMELFDRNPPAWQLDDEAQQQQTERRKRKLPAAVGVSLSHERMGPINAQLQEAATEAQAAIDAARQCGG